MNQFINTWYSMWETQFAVLFIWSTVCFILGALFCATCHWYWVRHVVRKAEKEVLKMKNPDVPVDGRDPVINN